MTLLNASSKLSGFLLENFLVLINNYGMPLSRFSDKLNGGIKFVPIIITGLPEFEARFWIMRDEKYISWSRVVLFSKTSLNSFSTPLINLFLHSEVEQGSKMMKWVELGRRVRLRAWQGSCTPC